MQGQGALETAGWAAALPYRECLEGNRLEQDARGRKKFPQIAMQHLRFLRRGVELELMKKGRIIAHDSFGNANHV